MYHVKVDNVSTSHDLLFIINLLPSKQQQNTQEGYRYSSDACKKREGDLELPCRSQQQRPDPRSSRAHLQIPRSTLVYLPLSLPRPIKHTHHRITVGIIIDLINHIEVTSHQRRHLMMESQRTKDRVNLAGSFHLRRLEFTSLAH
jgi:hypothetical protein